MLKLDFVIGLQARWARIIVSKAYVGDFILLVVELPHFVIRVLAANVLEDAMLMRLSAKSKVAASKPSIAGRCVGRILGQNQLQQDCQAPWPRHGCRRNAGQVLDYGRDFPALAATSTDEKPLDNSGSALLSWQDPPGCPRSCLAAKSSDACLRDGRHKMAKACACSKVIVER